MKGTIKICHDNQVIKAQVFMCVKHRREIIDTLRMIYGVKFNEMYFEISLVMSDQLLTHNDGTNIIFGGKIGGRPMGSTKLSKKDVAEIIRQCSQKLIKYDKIALRYNVSITTINRVAARSRVQK